MFYAGAGGFLCSRTLLVIDVDGVRNPFSRAKLEFIHERAASLIIPRHRNTFLIESSHARFSLCSSIRLPCLSSQKHAFVFHPMATHVA